MRYLYLILKIIFIIILFLLLAVLIGCSGSESTPEGKESVPTPLVEEKKETPSPKEPEKKETTEKKPAEAKIENPPKPETEIQANIYEYDPRGKRDPFEVYIPLTAGESSPEFPLTGFELKSIRLVGIIAGLTNPKAVVEAPDGKSYVIEVGSKIGKNDGSVVKILPDRIIVVEKKLDRIGNLIDEQVQIPLRIAEAEGANP